MRSKISPRKGSSMKRPVTSLYVISGRYKGCSLASPDSPDTHPMGSREKNALFNMLGPLFGLSVLDVFAGSGALGIEALSRGATSVTFVDQSPEACRAIAKNLLKIGVRPYKATGTDQDPTKILFQPLKTALQSSLEASYDIIIADPPYTAYASDLALLKTLDALSAHLGVGGRLVLSSPAKSPSPSLSHFTLERSHTYAAARLSIYTQKS